MARLNVSPTKSSLLILKRQLAFAEEGYDLLEQKRQILIFELMNRLDRARQVEKRLQDILPKAYAALSEALLDIGSAALDRLALGAEMRHEVSLSFQSLMGMRLARVTTNIEPAGPRFGVMGTSANTDEAMLRFVEVLPVIAELAELQNAVIRLAREYRRTQRRCNALSRKIIPSHKETITYIAESLEERERESFTILKMIRDRLASHRE